MPDIDLARMRADAEVVLPELDGDGGWSDLVVARLARHVLALCDRMEALKGENIRLMEALTCPEKIIAEWGRGAGPWVKVQHWAVKLLALSVAKTFRELGGENYVTCELDGTEAGPLVVTVQRKQGKSPVQDLKELRAEVLNLRSQLAEHQRLTAEAEGEPVE